MVWSVLVSNFINFRNNNTDDRCKRYVQRADTTAASSEQQHREDKTWEDSELNIDSFWRMISLTPDELRHATPHSGPWHSCSHLCTWASSSVKSPLHLFTHSTVAPFLIKHANTDTQGSMPKHPQDTHTHTTSHRDRCTYAHRPTLSYIVTEAWPSLFREGCWQRGWKDRGSSRDDREREESRKRKGGRMGLSIMLSVKVQL